MSSSKGYRVPLLRPNHTTIEKIEWLNLLLVGLCAGLGWLAGSGIFLGRYLDSLFGTAPFLLVLGAVGGMAGALCRLILVLQHLSRHRQ